MTIKVLEFKREDWRDAAKTLRKIADDLDAGEHPACTTGVLTLIGPKGEVTVFGLGPKCDDLQCLGAMEVAKANNDLVLAIQMIATLDSKTSQLCRSMDKRKFLVDAGPRPPFHPNCRTTFILLTKLSAVFAKSATRASVGADGGQQVAADLDYYHWLKQQPAAFQSEALGPTRARLFREGGLSVERFAELQLDRNFTPLTLRQMIDLEPLAFERASIIL